MKRVLISSVLLALTFACEVADDEDTGDGGSEGTGSGSGEDDGTDTGEDGGTGSSEDDGTDSGTYTGTGEDDGTDSGTYTGTGGYAAVGDPRLPKKPSDTFRIDCCSPNDAPGCGDFHVESCVCGIDPSCCGHDDGSWDAVCVTTARDLNCLVCP